ncbi:MAG: hypothetical protein VB086_05685 [Clostridiaceae bacterium]|nr:hypothetical protein [Clostridiaceae bacterium]
MKNHKFGKHVLCFLGIAVLLALVGPLLYAVVKVDKIPGLVIDREKKA